MKNLVIGLLINAFFLTACGRTPPLTQPTPFSSIDNPTSTPSPLPIATRTLVPSATPTASITPLPPIPTFTPTFDVSTIVTVTPAEKEECPISNPEAKLDTSAFQDHPEEMIDDQIYKPIFDYLNAGGSRQVVNLELLKNSKPGYPFGTTSELDLTNDGVNEFIVKINRGFGIYSCKNGGYQLILNWNGMVGEPASIVDIKDMNINGIPEVIAGMKFCSGHCFDISILEWDGQQFHNLIDEWKTIGVSDEGIIDTNNNKVLELVVSGPFPSMGSMIDFIPMRGQKDIYVWNGTNFSMSHPEFSSPEYRFQAIQDADMEVLDGYFDKALINYKDVIFSEGLSWWSEARREHEIKLYIDIWDPAKPTPPPEPSKDQTEYPRLAAYAYYRIMLLHLVQGYESDAGTVYNTLQQTFGDDPYARPYAEMASVFWEAYQSTQRMYDGCAAAIQYAAEHPEILTPLGSDYHGAQSHTYVPADVCPFR